MAGRGLVNCGAVTVAAAFALLAPDRSAAAVPCGSRTAHTLAQTAASRVYARLQTGDADDTVFACRRGAPGPIQLNYPAAAGDEVDGGSSVGRPIALTDRFLAHVLDVDDEDGLESDSYRVVRLVDLRSGRAVSGDADLAGVAYGHAVTDLVLAPGGALAYIGNARLVVVDRRGARRLDVRARKHTLSLDGDRIAWRSKDGRRRAGALRGTPKLDESLLRYARDAVTAAWP